MIDLALLNLLLQNKSDWSHHEVTPDWPVSDNISSPACSRWSSIVVNNHSTAAYGVTERIFTFDQKVLKVTNRNPEWSP